ncbi:FAD:protein FMN transferase [Arthrobacter sedimenti]|uniref:FAD:protein FMN transferase n=1 Tax=Arthrobacter sedimenti TaxID=2694931 RepID=UPI001CDB70A9|nr:FAD:protein FMN transferase [Arthrobacter sedimenti]
MTAPGAAPENLCDNPADSPIAGPAAVFRTMGTVVSFRASLSVRTAFTADLEQVFRDHDERFSLYRPDSELSRIATGHLALSRSSEELRDMYALAVEWRNATGSLFQPSDPDGRLDLNGVVKAHAIHRAGAFLEQQGATDWSLNCGGDILCSGLQSPGVPWTIGIADPADRTALVATVAATPTRRAIATSGTSERGQHIWARTRGETETPLDQVTVAAADILTADVLATAICAGGSSSIRDLAERFGVDVWAIDADRQLVRTP